MLDCALVASSAVVSYFTVQLIEEATGMEYLSGGTMDSESWIVAVLSFSLSVAAIGAVFALVQLIRLRGAKNQGKNKPDGNKSAE
jgi:hypothetical protein